MFAKKKLLFRLLPRAAPLLVKFWFPQNGKNEVSPRAGKFLPDELFCLGHVRATKLAINLSGYFFDLCQRRRWRSSSMSLRELLWDLWTRKFGFIEGPMQINVVAEDSHTAVVRSI
jgi:hypothetical protein